MNIPIIDLQSYVKGESKEEFAANLRSVCKNIGFFYVKNHMVPKELEDEILASARDFFALSKEEKHKIHMKYGGRAWRGYFQLGQEYTSGKIDLKEGLYLGQELPTNHPRVVSKYPLHGQNLFPQHPENLRPLILRWLDQMSKLGAIILQALAESLGLPQDHFEKTICQNHLGLLRLFHYPAQQNPDPSLWAVGQHTDYGLITMLLITDKGLQVKNRQNQWIDIDPLPGCFVVNLGDILQRITDGLYKSTPHRAKNTQGRSRYSIPYFYDPDWVAEISVLNFAVSQQQRQIQQAAKEYKRWDQQDLSYLKGSYGDYLIKKVSKVFPSLAQENL